MTKSDFVEQTTENMIEILKDKVNYNQYIIDQFKERGKDSSVLEGNNKQFLNTIKLLSTWNGCL